MTKIHQPSMNKLKSHTLPYILRAFFRESDGEWHDAKTWPGRMLVLRLLQIVWSSWLCLNAPVILHTKSHSVSAYIKLVVPLLIQSKKQGKTLGEDQLQLIIVHALSRGQRWMAAIMGKWLTMLLLDWKVAAKCDPLRSDPCHGILLVDDVEELSSTERLSDPFGPQC